MKLLSNYIAIAKVNTQRQKPKSKEKVTSNDSAVKPTA